MAHNLGVRFVSGKLITLGVHCGTTFDDVVSRLGQQILGVVPPFCLMRFFGTGDDSGTELPL